MPDNEALEKEILASQKLKELKKTQKLTPEQMHEKVKNFTSKNALVQVCL